MEFIHGKVFLITSLYDLVQIHYKMEITCVDYNYPNFTTCKDPVDMAYV
jgi:hypothetical protein